jgi:uncharacterized protein
MDVSPIMGAWPWYVAGPLLGGVGVALLVLGNRMLGMSGTFRVVCAAVAPRDIPFFRFDWRGSGGWNLAFALGIGIGGFLSVHALGSGGAVGLSPDAMVALQEAGIRDFSTFLPPEFFSWSALTRPGGILALVLGGFLVGFGASWAGGCTSGHGIMGLADLQFPSLVAVTGFFLGGFLGARFLVPLLL